MTKQNFIKYVSSFNKKPGDYTLDELYQIGVAHKKLIGRDKNWNELSTIVGTEYTGEQYRRFVVRRQDRDGTLMKNVNVLSEKTVTDIDDEDIANKTEELFKLQQRIRDERNAITRTLRDEARIDSLKDAIVSTVSKLKSMESVNYKPSAHSTKTGKESILLFSDLHIGVEVNSSYNVYNSVVAKKRVNKLVDETIHYCKVNNVKKLNVINLGDLIHGLIHITARIEEQFGVIEQVMVASEIISNALNRLQEAAPIITYRSCTDNHARTVADKGQAIEKDNFGRLVDWYLKERLKNTKIQFNEDNIEPDIGGFHLDDGRFVMFAHGHLDSPNTVFQNWVSFTKKFVDFIFLGHYHNERVKSFNETKVFINGSIVGPESYAHGKRLYGKPSQTLLVFDERNVINHSISLDIRED